MAWFQAWLDPGVRRDCRFLCLPPPPPLISSLESGPHDLPVQTGFSHKSPYLRQASFIYTSAQPSQLASVYEVPKTALAGQPRDTCDGLGHSGGPGRGRGPLCVQTKDLPGESAASTRTTATECRQQTPPNSKGSGCLHQKRERDAGQTETRGITTLPRGAVANPERQRTFEHALSL